LNEIPGPAGTQGDRDGLVLEMTAKGRTREMLKEESQGQREKNNVVGKEFWRRRCCCKECTVYLNDGRTSC